MKTLLKVVNATKHLFSNELKHSAKEYIAELNGFTAFARKKPSFIVAGVKKGGSTSLYNYLVKHPSIDSILQKEVHYFDIYFDKGKNWYLGNFPLKFLNSNIVGEATPTYLYAKESIDRIYQFNKDFKIIFLLRNPILRSYSEFKYGVKLGLRDENESFNKRILTEINWLNDNINSLYESNESFDLVRQKCHCIGSSLYNIWIKEWLKVFPKEQVKIVISENLFKNTQEELDEIFEFLGVDDFKLKNLKPHNINSYKDLDEETFNSLNSFFKPHVDELKAITKLDLKEWAL